MVDVFTLNSDLSCLDIRDAIHEKLTKAQAITGALLASGSFQYSDKLFYGVVWALDEHLEQIEMLWSYLDNELSKGRTGLPY